MTGLYLVDAMALAYRSFYALMRTGMRAPDGRPTTAVHGFAQSLLRVVESRGPSHMAIARDLPGPTFRHEMYALYKAQRQPMPDDLRAQIPLVEELCAACGLPMVSLPGFEADDLMATYARLAREAGIPAFLMTRDKDLMAMVGDGVRLYDPGRGSERPEEIDPAWVKAKFGVEPGQIRDYLALVGDASDNVPGVPRVGEKTASDLLSRYPDIDAIYAHLDEIGAAKKALRRNLEEGRASMELSRTLVTLRDDLEPPLPLEALEFAGLDIPRMRKFLVDLGMRALAAGLDRLAGAGRVPDRRPPSAVPDLFDALEPEPAPEPAPAARPPANLQTVSDRDDLGFALAALRAVPRAAVVPALGPDGAPVALGFSWGEGLGRAVALGEGEGRIAPELAWSMLDPVLADPSRSWVAHDSKELRRSLRRAGRSIAGAVDDIQLAAYLLAPGDRGLELHRLAQARTGRALRSWDELLGAGRSRRDPASVPVAEVGEWAAAGAEAMLQAWPGLEKDLAANGLSSLYGDVELPLSEVLLDMEESGIALDRDLFARLSEEMSAQVADLEAKAKEAAGTDFNVSSPRQLADVLFDRLGLKAGRKTGTGQRSTDSDTLEALRGEHPLPGIVLEHRELSKLLGTYLEPLPRLCDPQGRIHTRFQQVVAATGRLSSTDPNLQNIPVRGETGRRLRSAFVAGPGCVLVSADYSQVELRLLAHLSGDQALREVYRRGEDVHARTAALVAGVAPDRVTPDQRRAAKVVNFGVVYGMGPHALASQTDLPYAEAKRFIDGYFAAYPAVKPYMEGVLEGAREKGHVETILGRRRWIREINDGNRVVRERAEREAVNTPVQGSAADLVKLAMLAVDREIRQGRLPGRLLLQVHDELVLECPVEAAPEVSVRLRELMEGALSLSVPLSVEIGVGRDWGSAH